MELITTAYVQRYFPLWARYCDNDAALLADIITQSQNDLLGFICVDETTMTDPIRGYLFIIIKYKCFGLKNGDTEFQADPQIVKDYKDTYKLLLSYKKGEIPVDAVPKANVNKVKIESKDRLFRHGFGPCNPSDEEHKIGLLP